MPPRQALLELCAALLLHPAPGIRTASMKTQGGVTISPHHHDAMIQLDLVVESAGVWRIDGAEWQVRGASAAVFYPGQVHGYSMTGRGPSGELYSLKFNVNPAWPALRGRIFAPLVQQLIGERPLVDALGRLHRLAAGGATSPLLLATLAELLCLWPAASNGASASPAGGLPHEAALLDVGLQRVLDCIDARLAAPPTVAELAALVHFSERHFARHFRGALGCGVHAYITRCRLQRAIELLAQGRLTATEIGASLGFSSVQTFSRWFQQQTGSRPTDYRAARDLL